MNSFGSGRALVGHGTSLDYRTEIDGLRAIAVLLVVANHAKYKLFQGGFVGVDVFFVISGYLITRLIVKEVAEDNFSFSRFYVRRIRRIVPALLFTLVVCLPVAYLVMLPSELVYFSQAAIGAVFFVSNIVLWKQGGYFDVGSDLRPMLHLWSLAIEEQFYLGFPIVVYLVVKFRERWLSLCLWAMLCASLIIMFALHVEMPRASFYLLPTRAWELLVGSVVAVMPPSRNRFRQVMCERGSMMSASGVLAILITAVALDQSVLYPGWATLMPVIGTALILASSQQKSWVFGILRWKPLQILGLSSFSIFLWHQPLLVFGRLLSADNLSARQRDFVVLLTIIAGVGTWRFIEQPFRDSSRVRLRTTLLALGVSAIVVSGVSAFMIQSQGFRDRLPPNVQWENAGERTKTICESDEQWSEVDGIYVCYFGQVFSTQNVVLIGDSHADAMMPFLNELLVMKGLRGIRATPGRCPEIPGSYSRDSVPEDLGECERLHANLYRYIRDNRAASILAFRWNFRLFPVPGEIDRLEAINSEGGHEVEDYREYVIANATGIEVSAEAKTKAIRHLLNGLLQNSSRLVVIGPVPEIAWNIARVNLSHYRSRGEILENLSIPYVDYFERSHFVTGVIDDFERSKSTDRLQVIYPSDFLCNTFLPDRCVAQWQTIPFYLDDDHLSDRGVEIVLSSLVLEATSTK
ncbi:MAG: acyltransferase family protein [Actinomycetota bacterium]